MKDRNLPYEKALFDKFAKVTVNGVPLTHVRLGDSNYLLWQRFSQSLFSTEIIRFARTQNFARYVHYEKQGMIISLRTKLFEGLGILISLTAFIIVAITRPKVIVFGIDRISDRKHKSDFRTSELYEFLKIKNIPYSECLHTVFNRSFFVQLFQRRRPVLYLESIDSLYALKNFFSFSKKQTENLSIENLENFSDEEKKFVSYVVQRYMGLSQLIQFRIRVLSAFLKMSRAKVVWSIDDARHYQDIAAAARTTGVPSFAFQHGHFTKYHVGWLDQGFDATGDFMRPDFLVVWSAYWKHELERLNSVYPKESILIGGQKKDINPFPRESSSDIFVLVPHETDSPKEEVVKYLQMLSNCEGIRVVLKLRPDHSRKKQMDEYEDIDWSTSSVEIITNLDELNGRPNACLGTYSTFLYSMIAYEVPVGILSTSLDYGAGMVTNELANSVSLDSVCSDVHNLTTLDTAVLSERKEKLLAPHVQLSDMLENISRKYRLYT